MRYPLPAAGGPQQETEYHRQGAKLLIRIKTGAGAVRSLRDRGTYTNMRAEDPAPC